MNVQIEIFNTSFVVKCDYNEDILTVIQKYEKRFCNKEELEWSLPIEALQDFSNDLQKLMSLFSVEMIHLKDTKPYAILTRVDDKIKLKFTSKLFTHLDIFKLGMFILKNKIK